ARRIAVGLIGYGYWGPNLARNLAETDDFELGAIADARGERRELAGRRHPGVKTYADARALLERDDLEAIVVATPLATHHALARAALESGKHVLVEKPLAGTRADAEDLAECADRHGRRLMVDHTFVYTGAVRAIRALVS